MIDVDGLLRMTTAEAAEVIIEGAKYEPCKNCYPYNLGATKPSNKYPYCPRCFGVGTKHSMRYVHACRVLKLDKSSWPERSHNRAGALGRVR